MDDMIRRNDALDQLLEQRVCTPLYSDKWLVESCEERVKKLPAVDAVEVVRCRECVHSDTYPPDADNSMPLKCLGIRYGGVYPDWYCEHGQRREDGERN